MFTIVLFYKYFNVIDPEAERLKHLELCTRLALKGRIIVAPEGINATAEGSDEAINEYIAELRKDSNYQDIDYKLSEGTGNAFPKLSVKVRTEIVSAHLGEEDINPNKITGTHLEPTELNEWIKSGKKFYIIDMRNDYEHKSGHFDNSVLPSLEHFRDLPKVLPELEHLKDQTVVTVCTGGVRCEKASGYLKMNGFKDVYQLKGGIVRYMELYPNQDFLGKLYVFDNRVTMGFNTESQDHKVIGTCEKCGQNSDHYVNCAYFECHRHFIVCEECTNKVSKVYCDEECQQKDQIYQQQKISKTQN